MGLTTGPLVPPYLEIPHAGKILRQMVLIEQRLIGTVATVAPSQVSLRSWSRRYLVNVLEALVLNLRDLRHPAALAQDSASDATLPALAWR